MQIIRNIFKKKFSSFSRIRISLKTIIISNLLYYLILHKYTKIFLTNKKIFRFLIVKLFKIL